MHRYCSGLQHRHQQPRHSLLTEFVDGLPVVLVNSEPLTVPRPDVDVDWAEVVVLLMTWWKTVTIPFIWNVTPPATKVIGSLTVLSDGLTWCAAAWHLHVELHGVHAQDGVTDVTEHVVAGFHAHESWQLQQLLQLRLPPYKQTRLIMRSILREHILKMGRGF